MKEGFVCPKVKDISNCEKHLILSNYKSKSKKEEEEKKEQINK